MPGPSNAISDKTLLALFNKQLHFDKNDAAIDVNKTFAGDPFSLTQYALGYNFYRQRLQCIFTGGKNFIDVGCGAGNWTVAAGNVFDAVTGIDIHAERIKTAQQLALKAHPQHMPVFVHHNIQNMPFNNGAFDALLCYNVITFLNFSHMEFLKELRRIAAPGAKLYLAAHTQGFLYWLLYQAYKNRNRAQAQTAWNVYKHNLKFKIGRTAQPASWFPASYLDSLLKQSGWGLIHKGSEGSACGPALFAGTFLGAPLMQEYILKAE